MKITDVIQCPKFTELETLCKAGGLCTKLGERDSYYLGSGLVFGVSQKKFSVENNIRVEYGQPGRFCLSVSAFTSADYANVYYKVLDSEQDYGIEGFTEGVSFFHGLHFDEKFFDAQGRLGEIKRPGTFFQEGENRSMDSQGKFVFQYDYIKFDNVTYYFFGKPKKGTLQGFTYFLR